jgi:hypothetical protein
MRTSSGLLSYFFGDSKTKKIAMRGPGGKGQADVAVSILEKHEVTVKSNAVEIRCCLMNLSLPWELVVACILRSIAPP